MTYLFDTKNLENYLLDTVENILSNKITAVIGRDIYLIWKFYVIKWSEILDAAHKKAGFSNEELIIRLKSFPEELLKEIKIIDDNFSNDFSKIIDEINKLKD